MTSKDIALKNITILKQELSKMKPLIQDEINSVIVDGSIVRGDFCNHSSDIDLTITSFNDTVDAELKSKIEETIKRVQGSLPKRSYPRKPLVYDIQWQDINLVKETGRREINDWSLNNIPNGYPKLWLYAFDSFKYHKVIFGEDITRFYTKITPRCFVPLRLERIKKSAKSIGGEISTYEVRYGAITQVKNAWEAVRCICIANGLVSIHKNDVFMFAVQLLNSKEEIEIMRDLYEFYVNNNNKLITKGFRSRLFNFTMNIINKYS